MLLVAKNSTIDADGKHIRVFFIFFSLKKPVSSRFRANGRITFRRDRGDFAGSMA